MGVKKKYSIIPILLILTLSFILLFCHKASSITQIARGSNFELYFPTNSQLVFQHIEIPYVVKALNATVTVQTGTLNGTNCNLFMYHSDGQLTFTSQSSVTFDLSKNCVLYINGVKSSSSDNIVSGNKVRIAWSGIGWNPIKAIMGLLGIIIIIVTPTFTVYQVKKKKNYEWLVYCLIFFIIGYAFIVGWLT